MSKIRKKPCPYCGKKLQALNMRKWRNNLARHLPNACAPYQRRMIEMNLEIVHGVLRAFISGLYGEGEDGQRPPSLYPARPDPQRAAEVEELDKLYKQTGPEASKHGDST